MGTCDLDAGLSSRITSDFRLHRASQILDPSNTYLVNNKAVSSGDHSFDALADGKHVYCFSNEAWSASTKEVSFNVHGIVYVPESEVSSDPLETEGT